ncbi:MAG: aquaporin [Tepidisphaeraceae bacterium]
MVRSLVAEGVGTFALVLAGTGAIAADSVGGGLGHVGVALAFGLAVFAMIAAVGDVSGAHLNPAVSLGFVLARRLPVRTALLYVIVQCLAAIVASFCVKTLWPGGAALGVTQPHGISTGAAFILETLLTAGLMLVILGVTCGTKEQGLAAGLAVGGTVALEAMFAGPLTGASMNPARSLGPAVVGASLGSLWIYLVAPCVGATLAVYLNAVLRPCGCHPHAKDSEPGT